MVVTADGRGCRCAARRRMAHGPTTDAPRGEKANKKQMACVGAGRQHRAVRAGRPTTSSTRCCGTRCGDGPRPQHKHVWPNTTREVAGETVNAKEALFSRALEAELATRNSGHDRPVICLMDGEQPVLWEMQREHFAGRHPRPFPGAALGGGPLLPQGGQRVGPSVRRGAATGLAPGPSRVRDRRIATAAVAGQAQRTQQEGGEVGGGVPGEQPGAHAATSTWRRVIRSAVVWPRVPPSGEGPAGAGDRGDGRGSPGELHVRALYLNDQRVWLHRIQGRTRANPAISTSCSIAGRELRPIAEPGASHHVHIPKGVLEGHAGQGGTTGRARCRGRLAGADARCRPPRGSRPIRLEGERAIPGSIVSS